MSARRTDQYWFVQQNGTQYGPFSFAALVEATAHGIIRKGAKVWHPAWSTWKFADEVPGLFDKLPTDQINIVPETLSEAAALIPPDEAPQENGGTSFDLSTQPPWDDEAVVSPPGDRLDPQPIVERSPARRYGRVVLALLFGVVLAGAGATLIWWDRLGSGNPPAPPSATASAPPSPTDTARIAPPVSPQATALPDPIAKLPAVAALQSANSATFDKFRKLFAESRTANASEQEMLTQARAALRKSVRGLLARAPDDAIIEMTDVSLQYMQAMRSADAASCVALSDEGKGAKLSGNLARDYPAIFARDMKTLEGIAGIKPDGEIGIPTEEQIQAQLKTAFAELERKPVQLSLFNKDKLSLEEYAPYCDLVIAFYEAVRRLPRDDSAKLLRYLYAAAAADPEPEAPQQPPAKQ